MTNWDKRWIDIAASFASWSKDRSRKAGAVIVDDRNSMVSSGYNGFPRGVDDTVESRHQRPAKYLWTEHAERNAIYNAAADGHKTRGGTMYLNWYPCVECARAIIQCGITTVVGIEPDWNDARYGEEFAAVKEMFEETHISVRFVEGVAPLMK